MRKSCWLPLLSLAFLLQPIQVRAQQDSIPGHTISGTVVSVNSARSEITLRPSNVFGRLRMNLASYKVTRPMTLNEFRSGDRVTAVVWDADGTIHRLRRIRNCQVYVCGSDATMVAVSSR